MGATNTGMSKTELLAALRTATEGKTGDVADQALDEIIKHIQGRANVKLAGILLSAISAAPIVPGDGGAAFKTSLVTALTNAADKNEIG